MNSVAEILAAILGTLVLTLGGVGLGWWMRRKGAERERQIKLLIELSASASMLAGSLDRYLKAIEGAEAPLKNVEPLLSGITKIAQAQVVEISGLRKLVKELRDILFKRDETVKPFDLPSETTKDYAWRAQEMVQQNPGLNFSEAMSRLIEEESKQVIGSNQFDLG